MISCRSSIVALFAGLLIYSAGPAAADVRLVVPDISKVVNLVCDAEKGLSLLAPIPNRNDMAPDRAASLIVTFLEGEPVIVTGVSELFEGTLVARIPVSANDQTIRALGSDAPIQISRSGLSYVVPAQDVGGAILRFARGCHKETPRAPVVAGLERGGSYWQNDGSIVRLEASKLIRKFVFYRPSDAMRALNATEGSLRFEGQISGNSYSGTAYLYSEKCGRFPYPVTGTIENNSERVVLTGEAPRLDVQCKETGKRSMRLTFDFIKQ